MATGCVLGIALVDVGSEAGRIKATVDMAIFYSNNSKTEVFVDFDLPITSTNWKNVIADYLRTRSVTDQSEEIAPNDILFPDFSRG
jgi:hypothetical protein